MWKNILLIVICVSVVGAILGAASFSFVRAENALEDVADSSQTLLQDISSISLFAFVASDFFSGADRFEMELASYSNDGQTPNGHYAIIYRSYRYSREYTDPSTGEPLLEKIREEAFDISSVNDPISENEAGVIFDRVKYPISPFIDWERTNYNGIFGELLNAFQYVAYVIGMIWGALSLILLVLIDTVVTAWELITACLSIIGLKS